MVFEEGLDISSLPETLKEDFSQLDRLEGEYRVTSMLVNVVDSRKGPLCSFCNDEALAEMMNKTVRHELTITVAKVILLDLT